MRQEELELGGPLGPRHWYHGLMVKPAVASDGLGWKNLHAARFHETDSEVEHPAMTHHRLALVLRPPKQLDVWFEGVKQHRPSPAGSVALVPAGSASRWCWRGLKEALHVFLEPQLIERVTAEVFDRDPARLDIPPLEPQDLPLLRAAMLAVDTELTVGDVGSKLVVESLANVLAIQLVRQILAPRRPERIRAEVLPQRKLRAVVEFIEGHLDAAPTLEQMGAVAHLSPYYFARQFKAATGLSPHQYVIAQRVERAKQLLREDNGLSLTQIAARAGFSDQSKFSHHFKRLLGVTPGQFRMSARFG